MKLKELLESAIKPTSKQVASALAYVKQYVPYHGVRHASATMAKNVTDPDVVERLKYCYQLLRAADPTLGISSIPVQFLTYDMCVQDVKKAWQMFEYVPYKFITQEICELAIEGNGSALSWVPDNFQTPEMVERAVEEDPSVIQDVKPSLVTRDLCLLAVERNGLVLEFIPDRYKEDPEICVQAVLCDRSAMSHVPYLMRNEVSHLVKQHQQTYSG